MFTHHTKAGFTLIELAIVLVIIGLIVGGVLTGRTLINNAEIRAQINQIEKLRLVTNSFKLKYNALPGDISSQNAARFGLPGRHWTVQYQGPEDGIFNHYSDSSIYSGLYQGCGEMQVFWADLSKLKLIDPNITRVSTGGANWSANQVDQFLPQATLGNAFIYVYSWQGINYFGLADVDDIASPCFLRGSPNTPVATAYAIDAKIDDGAPTKGSVRSMYVRFGGSPAAPRYASGSSSPSTSTCFDANGSSTTNPWRYSTTINDGRGTNCALSFRF